MRAASAIAVCGVVALLTLCAMLLASRKQVASISIGRGRKPVRIAAMATSTLVSNVQSFKASMAELATKPAPRYVMFSSDLDPITQLPWCPDCVRTLPSVQAAVSARGGSLLEVRVGPRPVWRDPAHPFRLDPELQLRGIPTLFHVGQDGKLAQRTGPELEKAPGAAEALRVAEAFIKQTAP